jgi:hypothetical protein
MPPRTHSSSRSRPPAITSRKSNACRVPYRNHPVCLVLVAAANPAGRYSLPILAYRCDWLRSHLKRRHVGEFPSIRISMLRCLDECGAVPLISFRTAARSEHPGLMRIFSSSALPNAGLSNIPSPDTPKRQRVPMVWGDRRSDTRVWIKAHR